MHGPRGGALYRRSSRREFHSEQRVTTLRLACLVKAEHTLADALHDSAKLQRRAMSRDTLAHFTRSLNDAIVQLTDVLRDIM